MIVVLFAKVSVRYPRVVISSLAKRLENLLFVILTLPLLYDQRSLHVIKKVYYGLYARLCLGSRSTLTMLRFLGVVCGTTAPLAPCGPGQITMSIPTHPSKTHFA
jgi:hypothetical protein